MQITEELRELLYRRPSMPEAVVELLEKARSEGRDEETLQLVEQLFDFHFKAQHESALAFAELLETMFTMHSDRMDHLKSGGESLVRLVARIDRGVDAPSAGRDNSIIGLVVGGHLGYVGTYYLISDEKTRKSLVGGVVVAGAVGAVLGVLVTPSEAWQRVTLLTGLRSRSVALRVNF